MTTPNFAGDTTIIDTSIDWEELGKAHVTAPMEAQDLDEHATCWKLKKDIEYHLATLHDSFGWHRSTKASALSFHREMHELANEHAANLARRTGTITYLRKTFACRVTDSSFGSADDEWITDHVRRHETGDDLAGMLL